MSGLPPSTIFDFEPRVDQILDVVTGISSNYLTADRFGQLLAVVDGLRTQVNTNSSKIDALTDAVNNLASVFQASQFTTVAAEFSEIILGQNNIIALWQALLAALKNVATTDLQNQEIALLEKILGFTSTTPVSIGLDLENTAVETQPSPTAPGPLPSSPTSVGLDPTSTATVEQPAPTKSGP
jgi:outer membrane murein-binding lipoprotein Lpp